MVKGAAPQNAAPRAKKRGAVKNKLLPAFISMNIKVYLFLTRGAALGGAAPTDFFWRRSSRRGAARRLVGP